MRIPILVLVACLIVALLIACILLLQRRYAPKFQFSLRSFLGLLAIVAILFACTIGYRRNTMAQLTWIPGAKEDAAKLFPAAVVQKSADGRFEFVYYARNRAIQHLIAKNKLSNYSVTEEAVRVTSTDESEAQESLQLLQKTDTLSGGAFVIRGRLRDANGKPVSGATIDILGAFQFINCFRTRDDGTFTLALSDRDPSVPVGSGFYFRIRSANETANKLICWHSTYFSLDPNHPEMLLDIQIPNRTAPLDRLVNLSSWKCRSHRCQAVENNTYCVHRLATVATQCPSSGDGGYSMSIVWRRWLSNVKCGDVQLSDHAL